MNINPLALVDKLLEDWAGPKVRRAVHAFLLLVAVVVTIWLGADGDWKKAALAIAAAIYAGANTANTPKVPKYEEQPDGEIQSPELDASVEVPADLDDPDE